MMLDTKQESVSSWIYSLVRHWPRRTRILICFALTVLCFILSVDLIRDYPQPLLGPYRGFSKNHDQGSAVAAAIEISTSDSVTTQSTSYAPLQELRPNLIPMHKPEQEPKTEPSVPERSDQDSISATPDTTKQSPAAEQASQGSKDSQITDAKSTQKTKDSHSKADPISQLIEQAKRQQEAIMSKRTFTLPYAAEAYRTRRGRHPPPHFDAWYEYARDRDVVIVEEFWDLIYHDLKPFWAVDQGRLKRQAASAPSIRIRDAQIAWKHDFFWCNIASDMIEPFVRFLPDLDIVMNLLDEPRVVVPWEDINKLVQQENQLRSSALDVPLNDVKRDFSKQTVSQVNGKDSPDKTEDMQVGWHSPLPEVENSYWPLAVQGCPENSPAKMAYEAQKATLSANSSVIPARPINLIDIEAVSERGYAKQGFIQNYTGVVDLCEQPELEFLHGGLVQPLTTSHRSDLLPLFGGSKMSVHNDIIMPAPMHYALADTFVDESHDELRDTNDVWPNMLEEIMWRGTTSGGYVTAKNWKAFHRHRFVALTNPDQLALYDEGHKPDNWMILDNPSVPAIQQAGMEAAVSRAAMDHALNETFRFHLLAAFTDDPCTPITADPVTGECHVGKTIQLGDRLTLQQQFKHKYLPDVDGNSYSGRFRAFLLSDAVPIKATIYREWFDQRILPWIHFVPMSNTYHEFYAIMEYFFGYKSKNGDTLPSHDEQAKWIAKSGREWSEKVLRREDQEVYMFRLLLEYARVLEDDRDRLGYVDDLL